MTRRSDWEWDDAPVCPACGHRNNDASEIDFGAGLDGEADVTCPRCGAEYRVERMVDVMYRSGEPDDET